MSIYDNLPKDQILAIWQQSAVALETAKAQEMELRKLVVAQNSDGQTKEGTENVPLGNGYKLKIVHKLNYRLDTTPDAVDSALTAIEKLGAEGQFIADRLVKFKPELSISEYCKLDTQYKVIIDKVLTTSEGSPSVEIIEPKTK